MHKSIKFIPLLALLATGAQAQTREVNIICSAQAAWCSMIAVTFEKSQGIKVNMTAKGSGEAIA
ncbi:MAG: iron ABC transporter substrate-binding protein, partial [Limnohabitans sp.]